MVIVGVGVNVTNCEFCCVVHKTVLYSNDKFTELKPLGT